MVTPLIPTYYLTLAQYADQHNVSERTVKRWLSADELPGATKNEHGAWQIPSHAQRTVPAGEGQTTLALRPEQNVTAVQYDPPAPMPAVREIPAGRTFFSAAEAAELMSCPELRITAYAIKKHREYYHGVEAGPNGMIVVPAYRILQLKGLLAS